MPGTISYTEPPASELTDMRVMGKLGDLAQKGMTIAINARAGEER